MKTADVSRWSISAQIPRRLRPLTFDLKEKFLRGLLHLPASFSNFSGLCSCSGSAVLADVIMSEMGLRREARYLIRRGGGGAGAALSGAGQTCLARGACAASLIDQQRQRCFMNTYFRPSRLLSRVHASEGKHASFVGGARELRG